MKTEDATENDDKAAAAAGRPDAGTATGPAIQAQFKIISKELTDEQLAAITGGPIYVKYDLFMASQK